MCMSMRTASRIELIDPNNEKGKPLLQLTVPGEVTTEQIKKNIKISVSIKVDLGDKNKRKSAEVDLMDKEIKEKLEAYIDNLIVRIYAMNTNEEIRAEANLQEIKSE